MRWTLLLLAASAVLLAGCTSSTNTTTQDPNPGPYGGGGSGSASTPGFEAVALVAALGAAALVAARCR